jgi:lactate dehydrogenase-like 2-hydroxyacid dehydrogenase
VTNTPDVLTDATADMAFLLILNACRRAHEYDGIMRKGWGRAFGMGDMLGIDASGKTLGIFGMGRIGRAVAQRARGFNMKIVYHNKTRLPPELEQGATYYPTLNEMLPHCQILSVHAPAGPTTNKVMNAQTLGLLPKGAVFVNTARGTLVDEDALFDALKSGHLFAAGLDVFHNEPNADKRFATLENTFLVPHMGSATVETRKAMGDRALDNIAAVLAGRPPIDPLWV